VSNSGTIAIPETASRAAAAISKSRRRRAAGRRRGVPYLIEQYRVKVADKTWAGTHARASPGEMMVDFGQSPLDPTAYGGRLLRVRIAVAEGRFHLADLAFATVDSPHPTLMAPSEVVRSRTLSSGSRLRHTGLGGTHSLISVTPTRFGSSRATGPVAISTNSIRISGTHSGIAAHRQPLRVAENTEPSPLNSGPSKAEQNLN